MTARLSPALLTTAANALFGVVATGALFLTACSVGPKYQRPAVASPGAYKELTPETAKDVAGWKTAQPQDQDATLRGKWWEVFGDPQLNALEEQADTSNQNIASAAANFLQARATV